MFQKKHSIFNMNFYRFLSRFQNKRIKNTFICTLGYNASNIQVEINKTGIKNLRYTADVNTS